MTKPWKPCNYELHDVAAIQALAQGKATSIQQIKALEFIVHEVCRTYDMPYQSESSRDTDFACGMLHVGKQLVKFTKLNIQSMQEINDGRSGSKTKRS